MDPDLAATLRGFIAGNFLCNGDLDWLTDSTSFRKSGLIDSAGTVELVLFLEETFGIAIQDQDMLPENFDCIGAIAAFIGRKVHPLQEQMAA
jgi:acyl carrier protein